MRFEKNFPDELLMQIQLSDVISKKVILKKHGKEFSGLCPFHNEKTPSFTVNDQKGFYHCFGCGAHGSAINFVMENEGLGFKEAVIKLAGDYGITIPYIKENQSKEEKEQVQKEYLILEKACQFFQNNLLEYTGGEALNYLKARGLNDKNIKNFRLGFALNSFDSLINYLKKENFTDKDLLESGLVSKSDSGKLYDKFRGRIIFPILDKKSQIIAFGGRAIGDEQPKYLNSPETKLFKKGSNLYNFSLARKAIFEEKFGVIVEGYMDVISLAINGVENVVAPLGTALTSNQLQELFRITSDVIICLDGDSAGIKAARRAIDTSLPMINAKNMVRFVFLPNGMDPDDFIKENGRNALQNLFKEAKNLSEVLFDFESSDLNINFEKQITPEIKAQLESKLLQKVNLINDQNSKKHFFSYYKDRLFFINRSKMIHSKNWNKKNKINIDFEIKKSQIFEENILLLLINFPQLINYKDDFCSLREIPFESEESSNLKDLLIDFLDQNENFSRESFLDLLQKRSHLKTQKINFFKQKLSYDLDQANLRLRILILKFFHQKISDQYSEILARIDEVETNETTILSGKQKELFDYKTLLEKEILKLENEIT